MAALVKTASVLKCNAIFKREVTFDNYDDDNPTNPYYKDLVMTVSLWEDLGSPDEITVTVQPGNTLEEENV